MTKINLNGKYSKKRELNSENKFKKILDLIPAIVFEADLQMNIIYANQTAFNIFGYTQDDLDRGLNIKDVIAHNQIEKIKNVVRKNIEGELKEPIEYLFKKKNGLTFWGTLYAKPIYHTAKMRGLIYIINVNSQHKLVESEFQSLDFEYKDLYDAAPIAYFSVDGNGLIKRANFAAQEFVGYQFEELQTMNIFELYSEESKQKAKQLFRKFKNGLSWKNEEMIYKRKDGEKVFGLLSTNSVVDEQGNIIESRLIVVDITKRKKIEEELKESEKKYRNLLETASVGIIEINLENIALSYVNPEILKLTEYTLDELKNFNIMNKVIHPEDFKKLFKDHKEKYVEFRIISKSGKIKWVVGRRTNYYEKGKRPKVRLWIQDITELKSLENKLTESENRYRLITENANDLIAILDESLKFEYINENSYKKILGYTYDDLVGKSAITFIHPKDLETAVTNFKKGFEEGEGSAELRFMKKNGSFFWIDVRGRTFINELGIKKALIISRDISIRKNFEEKMKNYMQDLEREVEIRTKELVQSEKLASIGLLAAGIAHEINNPITGVINYAQIIKDTLEEYDNIDLKSKPFSFIDGIIRESERISNIVDDLLFFARKDRGDFVNEDINRIIRSTIDLLLLKFKNYQIDFKLNFQDNIPKIPMRTQNIQQVILNVLQNSIDALNEKFGEKCQPGLKKIQINTSIIQIDNKRNVKIEIKDNGIGIRPQNQKKLFDPFFTTKKYSKEHGTGLGLSVSYRIIKNHKGEIQYRSEWKKWTDTKIILPLER
ncbi:MAG: PAS domain-containing sensor histidine kinase [Candidatus Helarchaeota archaeon]